ncbi:MAG: peptide deformylase [Planctomycetota bacterium]|jgi:peptide deformylase
MMDVENCRITHYPARVLAERAQPVEKTYENIHQLVARMTEIMLENKGIGLAAPQAGVPLRLFIISLDASKEGVKVYINPTVKPLTDEFESIEEGCLSVPGISTKIRRFRKCKVTATGLDGEEFTEEAEGLYARALQHEYDHIEGITITDRMGSAAKIVHRKQLKALRNAKTNE